jgi:hypothetical protein
MSHGPVARIDHAPREGWVVYGLRVLLNVVVTVPSVMVNQVIRVVRSTTVPAQVQSVRLRGITAAGPDAIGIVSMPSGPTSLRRWREWARGLAALAANPGDVAHLWGHTAVYVRQGGIVTLVLGFGPSDPVHTVLHSSGIVSGLEATPGAVHDDRAMLTSANVRTAEWAVSDAMAERFYQCLQAARRQTCPNQYTAVASVHRQYRLVSEWQEFSNCILWVADQFQESLGAVMLSNQVGPLEASRHNLIPVEQLRRSPTGPFWYPGEGSQSQLMTHYTAVGGVQLDFPHGGGLLAPTIGALPPSLQILMVGRTLFLVTGMVTTALDLYRGDVTSLVRFGGLASAFAALDQHPLPAALGGVQLLGSAFVLICPPAALNATNAVLLSVASLTAMNLPELASSVRRYLRW